MPIFSRLSIPAFDLCWLHLIDGNSLVLICGGGGAMKSGVKNEIQMAIVEGNEIKFLPSFGTDILSKSNLCTAISSGIIRVSFVS